MTTGVTAFSNLNRSEVFHSLTPFVALLSWKSVMTARSVPVSTLFGLECVNRTFQV